MDGKWWKRYRKDGLFARGNGEWWIEAGRFFFRRYLTRKPIVIPFDRLSAVEIGTWHAGRWGGGRPIIKLSWEQDGRWLTAGFVLASASDETRRLVEMFGMRG